MLRDFLRAALTIAGKDLRAELRSRELLGLMALFALLAILVFSFALELDRPGRQDAVSGVLWVTLLFASILGHNRSVALEREHGGFDALLLAPVARGAIFAGKLLANALFTLIIALLLLPLLTVLYNLPAFPPALLLIVPPGCLGLAAIGTLLAAMTVQTRARDSLLPVLLLPVALPLLVTALRASNAALGNLPQAELQAWLLLLLLVDLIYLAAGFLLYESVLES